MNDVPLKDFKGLSENEKAQFRNGLSERSLAGDAVARITLLFIAALQALPSHLLDLQGGTGFAGDARAEEVAISHLHCLLLFNQAFRDMKDQANTVLPEEMLEDYIYLRAVFTRLQRVQAALSLGQAGTIERDLRSFATHHATSLPPAVFEKIVAAASMTVPTASEQADHIISPLRKEQELSDMAARKAQLTPLAREDGTIW